MPRFRSQAYGVESARAVMDYGKRVIGLQRIGAITSLDNQSSINLLNKVGLRFEPLMELGEKREQIRLFAWNLE